jgi:hypothetical protein
MKPYATEVEFLRDEVEKCHASMHSQVETLKLLMEKHIKLQEQFESQKKREWSGFSFDELHNLSKSFPQNWKILQLIREVEKTLKERNA